MKKLVYDPQPNATVDELMQILKVFTYGTLPDQLKTDETLFAIYEGLPAPAKRHFKVIVL